LDVLDEDAEVLVVYDFPEDTTVPALEGYAALEPRLRPLLNTYGRGPANAIRFGLDNARSTVSVVTMADASDDVTQIKALAAMVKDGVAVAAASRYMKGGEQVGGPLVKRWMSRLAGLSLYWIGRVGTRDSTNSFKAYSTDFVRSVGIESKHGFELGIELVAKARRLRLEVREIPTRWVDRAAGSSNFKLIQWLPHYLKWYLFALGRPSSITEMQKRLEGASG
jgi:glycosyltransferase involved in cell wall biosynthesis